MGHKNPFEPQERPTLNSEKHFPKKPKAQKNNRNLKPQKDTQNLKPQKNNQNLKPQKNNQNLKAQKENRKLKPKKNNQTPVKFRGKAVHRLARYHSFSIRLLTVFALCLTVANASGDSIKDVTKVTAGMGAMRIFVTFMLSYATLYYG